MKTLRRNVKCFVNNKIDSILIICGVKVRNISIERPVRHLGDPVKSISEYISAVEETIKHAKSNDSVVVFRGESKVYDTPCQPNIFRTRLSKSDRFFEKNLFEEMSANHLTNGKTYLEIAIDAQHGGFPSRLLDVTYNCLVALYFAVTPYYTEREADSDEDDGMVYVFFMENLYCPTGNNINEAYDACINHKTKWFDGQELFQKNHKLIDHIKKNPRIIAQQGAFILFQGERLSSFPRYSYEAIKIDKDAKVQLRNDLRLYFGIHTGSIYPEEFNLVSEMLRKSEQVSSKPFSLEGEMDLIFHNIERLTEHYLDKIELAKETEYQKLVEEIEGELMDYHLRMEAFLRQKKPEKSKEWEGQFNELIVKLADEAESLMDGHPDFEIKICRNELKLKSGE